MLLYSILYNNINKKRRSIIIKIYKDNRIKHCCYHKVYYKDIQHLYKQGASSSTLEDQNYYKWFIFLIK